MNKRMQKLLNNAEVTVNVLNNYETDFRLCELTNLYSDCYYVELYDKNMKMIGQYYINAKDVWKSQNGFLVE